MKIDYENINDMYMYYNPINTRNQPAFTSLMVLTIHLRRNRSSYPCQYGASVCYECFPMLRRGIKTYPFIYPMGSKIPTHSLRINDGILATQEVSSLGGITGVGYLFEEQRVRRPIKVTLNQIGNTQLSPYEVSHKDMEPIHARPVYEIMAYISFPRTECYRIDEARAVDQFRAVFQKPGMSV